MPSEFGYPGLPTNRQQSGKKTYTNDDLVARKPLSIDIQQSPAMRALYEDDGVDVDALLAEANKTLAVPPPSSYFDMLRGDAARADAPAAAAQRRAEFRAGPVGGSIHALTDNPAVTAATVAGSFVPHPLAQGASKALLALQSAAGVLDPETSLPEKALWAGGAALGLRSSPAAVAGPKRPVPGMHWTARKPAESLYRVAGELPENIAGSADDITELVAGSPSMQALRQTGAPEAGLIGETDLTGAINALSEAPLSPQDIARARAAERFGKTYRSERTMPQSRYVGEQEGLMDGDPSFGMFEHEISPGKFSTGASLDDLNRKGIALPAGEYDEAGRLVAPPQAPLDPAYAAHVGSSKNKHAPVNQQDQARMRELITQLFGENASPAVSRMTAEQALLDDAAIGITKTGKPISGSSVDQNNVLFGGASSREFGSGPEAGDFVRPKDRRPIGKRPNPPAWRFGREEAVQWNQ
jgi:hypothetical protein